MIDETRTAAANTGVVPPSLGRRIAADYSAFVGAAAYPCLGARSSLRSADSPIRIYGPMAAPSTTAALARDLSAFARAPHSATRLVTMVAMFVEPAPESEAAFEEDLWRQLDALAAMDEHPWAERVSSNVSDPTYAFSFAGVPFFVIGLHPESSRLARRLPWPALVFNPHEQFRALRATGRFESLRAAIRRRDVALQGNINPNLADAGEASEALQYSGRDMTSDGQCPFHSSPPEP